MSIIVKGIDVPKDCDSCQFFDDYHDYPTCGINQRSQGYTWKPFGQRMSFCPIEYIPSKHGRLIDADELIKEFHWCMEQSAVCNQEQWQDVIDRVGNALTIIQANFEE